MPVHTQSTTGSHSVSLRSVIERVKRPNGSRKVLLRVLEKRPGLARWILDTINSERFSLETHQNSTSTSQAPHKLRLLMLLTDG